MKIRNGFVSNSSSSSFIIAYHDIIRSHIDLEEEEILKLIEDVYLDLPNFAILFENGTSGDVETMLVQPDDEIKNFIRQHKLFTNNRRFVYLIKDVILLKHLELEEESDGDRDHIVELNRNLIRLVQSVFYKEDLSQYTSLEHSMQLDYSSILDHHENKLDKFRKYLTNYEVFDPEYAKHGYERESIVEEDNEIY